jgi:hypothetical protein
MRSVLLTLAFLTAVTVLGCPEMTPAARPEAGCRRACQTHASQCSDHDCARGCGFILDRLVEHETEAVVACVARSKPACDDSVWANCAANVGPHADGGPPPPPAPVEE